MLYPDISEDLRESLQKFTRGEIAVARYDLLMEQRLDATVTAENARKSRKLKVNKILQEGGVLYSGNARRMNQERLQLERAREQEREAAWQKKYDIACKKVFKQTKGYLKTWQL